MGAIVTIGALAAGAYLLSKSGGAGGVASLFGGVTAKPLYQPTDADITQIMSRYPNGGSRFSVCNVINGARICHTLGDWMKMSIQQLQTLTYQGDSFCSGLGGQPGQGVQTAAGLATTGIGAAEAAGQIGLKLSLTATKAIPIIGSIIQIADSVFTFLQAHHAAAVAKENQILCVLVPQVNAAFTQVLSGMRNGTIAGADAKNAIENIRLEVQKSVAMDAGSGALQAELQVSGAVCDAFQLIIARSGI